MRKLLLALPLVALSGCAQLQTLETVATGTVSANNVYLAGNAFAVAQATATQYLKLPTCPAATGVCKTQAGVNAVVPAIRAAYTAVTAMNNAANGGATAVPVSVYATATTAISALQAAITAYNPKSGS